MGGGADQVGGPSYHPSQMGESDAHCSPGTTSRLQQSFSHLKTCAACSLLPGATLPLCGAH